MCIRDRLLSFVWCYDGPNQPPKLCTIFEVDTFSHCINIKRKPQMFGSSPSTSHSPFFLGETLWWALANPTSLPILKSLFSVVSEILKGNPKILVSSLAYIHAHFSSECDFMMALGKLKQHTIFEVASLSCCRNIKGNSKILGSSHSPWPHPLFLLVGFHDGPW